MANREVITATFLSREVVFASRPTRDFLACPMVQSEQLRQRWRGIKLVLIEGCSAGARDIAEAEASGEEACDGGFVGRIEHGSAGAAARCDLESQLERREGVEVGWLKVQIEGLSPIELRGDGLAAVGVR